MKTEEKQYAQRDIMALDEAGNHYIRHVDHMTREKLHSKSDIAAELGWRDMQIAALQQRLDAVFAENAALKSKLMYWDAEDPEAPYSCPEDIANNCAMDLNTEFDVQVAAKMPNRTYRVSEVGEYDCKIELVSGSMPETPATDAILNAVRAEGVEMLAENHQRIVDMLDGDSLFGDGEREHAAIAAAAVHFAAQLRAAAPEPK